MFEFQRRNRMGGEVLTHHWNNQVNTTQPSFAENESETITHITNITDKKNEEPSALSDKVISSLANLLIIDVPREGNCLFWATALAYLLSSENQRDACLKLFDTCDIGLVEEIIKIVSKQLKVTFEQSIPFFSLVHNFRTKIVNHMCETLASDTVIDNVRLTDHLKQMGKFGEWGGREEIEAISDFLRCKITVVNCEKLEYTESFGAGSIHLYLFLKNQNHYLFGLQKANIQRLSPLVMTNQVLEHKELKSNAKKTNVPNNLEGISWATNLKNALNKPSKIQPAALVSKQSSKGKERVGQENSIDNIYLDLEQLKEIEVLELIEELKVLEEIEKLEEEIQEIEKTNEINVLAPLQILHPLNFFTPYSRLKKLINWLISSELTSEPILEERIKIVEKLKEAKKIHRNIAVLRNCIKRKEKEWFSVKEKIKQPRLAKVEKQITELSDKIEYFIAKQDKEIEYKIAKQAKEKAERLRMLNEEREQQLAMLNEKEVAIENQKACLANKDIIRMLGITADNINKLEDIDEIQYCINKLRSDSEAKIECAKSVLESTGYTDEKSSAHQEKEFRLEQKFALGILMHHRSKLEVIDEILCSIEKLRNDIEIINNAKYVLESVDRISQLTAPQKSALSMLEEKIALQRAYLGLKGRNFSDTTSSGEKFNLNFICLQEKWRERKERIRYFAELPFVDGVPDDNLEIEGLINKCVNSVGVYLEQASTHINDVITNEIAPTINPYSIKLARAIVQSEELFFKCLGFYSTLPECSVEVTGIPIPQLK